MKPAPKDPSAIADDFQEELLDRAWPDAVGVSASAHKELMPTGAIVIADGLRTQRKLLGVWSPRLNTFVFPDFQFDESGRPLPEVPELLTTLPAGNGGWRETFWLYSPHALLDGQSPAEVFAENPRLVIDVARIEFCASPDDHW